MALIVSLVRPLAWSNVRNRAPSKDVTPFTAPIQMVPSRVRNKLLIRVPASPIAVPYRTPKDVVHPDGAGRAWPWRTRERRPLAPIARVRAQHDQPVTGTYPECSRLDFKQGAGLQQPPAGLHRVERDATIGQASDDGSVRRQPEAAFVILENRADPAGAVPVDTGDQDWCDADIRIVALVIDPEEPGLTASPEPARAIAKKGQDGPTRSVDAERVLHERRLTG